MATTAAPTPSALYYALLAAFHIFPIHAPLTLWVFDAPFGKFAKNVWGNVDGNKAWVVMEAVAVSPRELVSVPDPQSAS